MSFKSYAHYVSLEEYELHGSEIIAILLSLMKWMRIFSDLIEYTVHSEKRME